jgi:hypothetical protein
MFENYMVSLNNEHEAWIEINSVPMKLLLITRPRGYPKFAIQDLIEYNRLFIA